MNALQPYYNGGIGSGSGSSLLYGLLLVLLSILFIVLVTALIIGIISYFFMAIGLYTMAKNRKLDHAWMAWIPIASGYLMGELINDDVSISTLHIPYAKIFLPLAPFAFALMMSILGLIPQIGMVFIILLSLALSVYQFTALFWLFSIYNKDHRVLFLVLSILFPFMGPIFVFVIRNKEGYDERHPEEVLEVNYDSKSIIALSLGIFSILSCITLIGFSALIGAVGLIFAMIAMKEQKALGRPSGMALAGLICSIVGLSLTLIVLIACVGLGATGLFNGMFNGMFNGTYY
ncbi:MAG: DUF4190 domain-containing protein [Eubacteriaceae bacterium]|nr:DUF4190 domain-containing protein [Eubacteriaceae bacterium]